MILLDRELILALRQLNLQSASIKIGCFFLVFPNVMDVDSVPPKV